MAIVKGFTKSFEVPKNVKQHCINLIFDFKQNDSQKRIIVKSEVFCEKKT